MVQNTYLQMTHYTSSSPLVQFCLRLDCHSSVANAQPPAAVMVLMGRNGPLSYSTMSDGTSGEGRSAPGVFTALMRSARSTSANRHLVVCQPVCVIMSVSLHFICVEQVTSLRMDLSDRLIDIRNIVWRRKDLYKNTEKRNNIESSF